MGFHPQRAAHIPLTHLRAMLLYSNARYFGRHMRDGGHQLGQYMSLACEGVRTLPELLEQWPEAWELLGPDLQDTVNVGRARKFGPPYPAPKVRKGRPRYDFSPGTVLILTAKLLNAAHGNGVV